MIKTDDLLRNGRNMFGVQSGKVIHREFHTFVSACILKCDHYAKTHTFLTILILLFTLRSALISLKKKKTHLCRIYFKSTSYFGAYIAI